MDLNRHPWARDGVRMPATVLHAIETHALESYAGGMPLPDGGFEGEEACGVVDGPADGADVLLADRAVCWPNLANRYHKADPEEYPRTGRTYFLIDPLKFSRAMTAAEGERRPIKVLYHSHLDCGAYFSETDTQTALAGGNEPSYDLAFLVISVRGDGRGGQARVDDRRLFVWDPSSATFVVADLRIE